MNKKLLLASLLSAFVLGSQAQENASTLLKASTEDANKLLGAYTAPVLKSIGAGLNGGWFQTAKPLGLGGFNLNINVGTSFIPTSDQQFDINSLGLSKLTVVSGQSSISPTALGDNKSGPEVELKVKSPFPPGNDTSLMKFKMPEGAGIHFAPVPLAQLSVGVGFGTEIGIRYLPQINSGEFSIALFGFAVKHDFKQWIPGIKAAPFDLSAMFGYTQMNGEVEFKDKYSVQAPDNSSIYNPTPSKVYSGQALEYSGQAWTSNIIISKKLGPFTPYLGVGYQSSTIQADIKGVYPVVTSNELADAANPAHPSFGKAAKIEEIKDPISIKSSLSGFRANAGFRLKFAVITLHADYTFAEYNLLNVGIGISMQSLAPPKM